MIHALTPLGALYHNRHAMRKMLYLISNLAENEKAPPAQVVPLRKNHLFTLLVFSFSCRALVRPSGLISPAASRLRFVKTGPTNS